MKLKKSVGSVVLTAVLSFAAPAATFKKYEVRSGKVNYTIHGSGNIMGSTQKLAGKKHLIFDQYGFRELEEEATVQTIDVMGQRHKEKNHKLLYRNGTKVKIVDFQHETVTETEPPGMVLMIAAARQNLTQMGENFLKQMGARKVGTDTVAGYRCDIWKLPAVTQCLYRGVPLRIESNVMGIRRVETATKAEFDVPVSEADYKIPDFPIRNLRVPSMGNGAAPTPQEMKAMMQGMGRSGSAPAADPVSIMKQQFLAQEPTFRFAKTCLDMSKKLSEANDCEKMFSHRLGEPSQPFKEWDAKTKASVLKEINRALKSMDCVRKAQTMQAIGQCEPKD